MLQFTVIAGPNGAGKSTLSARMSRRDAIIFDPDKEKLAIERSYPDISDEAIESAVTRKYEQFELRAIAKKQSLTVETNLRNEFLAHRAALFKEGGYVTQLVFMMLPDVESSMDRVNLRVKQKGHFVDHSSIRYNFKASLDNLLKVADLFDQVMLVCAASEFGIITSPERLLVTQGAKVLHINPEAPEWAHSVMNEVINIIRGRDRGFDPDHKIGR
jgi:predicted ABC-type ATPase